MQHPHFSVEFIGTTLLDGMWQSQCGNVISRDSLSTEYIVGLCVIVVFLFLVTLVINIIIINVVVVVVVIVIIGTNVVISMFNVVNEATSMV